MRAATLAGIPGIIVQGRYDLLCPPATSHALAARWPDAEIRIIEGAGHIAVRSRRAGCGDEGDRRYGVEDFGVTRISG